MTSLVTEIDAATAKNKKSSMRSFVIVLDKSDEMEKKIKEFAEKNQIKNTVLALDNPAGPKGYNINEKANVTVLLYSGKKVKVNYAFEKGKMTKEDIQKILAELPMFLEKKKN